MYGIMPNNRTFSRKILMIDGAQQVGKSYIIRRVGQGKSIYQKFFCT